MLLNVKSDAKFQAYLDRMEQKLHVQTFPIIAAAMRLHLSRGSLTSQLHIHQRGEPLLLRHYRQIYLDMFDSLPERIGTKQTTPPPRNRTLNVIPSRRSRREEFIDDQLSYIEREATQRIRDISQTTSDSIVDILMRGVRDGMSVDEIGRRIYNDIDDLSRGRAATIARTETHAAAMTAQWEAIDSNQYIDVQTKTWWCALDARTRPSHLAMHGVTVGINDPFETDDGDCLFPGDDSLGMDASGLVNCRCSCLYQTESATAPDEGNGDFDEEEAA